MKTKDILLLVVLIIAGIVAGGFLAQAAKSVPWASFLAYTKTFGLAADKPAVFDFSVLRIAFGFELNINVAQILCVLAAILIYRKIK